MLEGLIRAGMKVVCEVKQHLAADRYLVSLSGKEMVMQFAGSQASGDRLHVQVVEVRPDLVLARVLESERAVEEILSGLRIPSMDRSEAIRVVEILSRLQFPLNEENIRKLINLRRLLGDDEAALALFLKGVPLEQASRFKTVFGKDPALALARLEKYALKNPEGVEKYDKSLFQGLLSTGRSGLLGLIAESLGWTGPTLDSSVFQSLLTGLKRGRTGGREDREAEEDADLLLGRISLDRLKSVLTPGYAVFFETLFWKSGSGWHQADVRAERTGPEGPWRLEFRTEFERLGPVEAEIVLRPERTGEGRIEVRIGFEGADSARTERLRKHFQDFDPGWTVVLYDAAADLGGQDKKIWRKLDVVV
jgi:hypothetical protein